MKYLVLLLLPLAIFAFTVFWPLGDPRRSALEKVRTVSRRLTLFTWMLGGVLLAGLILLPNKQRVLMLSPLYFIALAVGRVWKTICLRLREQREKAVDLESMKRAN